MTAGETLREEIRQAKEEIYRREMEASSGEPAVIRLAKAFSAFLRQKPVCLEEPMLAGQFLFSGCRYSNPVSLEQECTFWETDHNQKSELLRAFLAGEQSGAYNRSPGGHVVAGYGKLLQLGVDGLLQQWRQAACAQQNEKNFQAGVLCLEAFSDYIQRYAQKAKEEGYGTTAQACEAVSHRAPQHFFEALQLLCLAHEAVTLEQLSGSLSLGRVDFLLAPYYDRDIAAGLLTAREAREGICAFWRLLAGTPRAFQNVTLGGYSSETGYFCHDLTCFCLQASRIVAKDQPLLSLRVHPEMPDRLWEEVFETLATGMGFPALFQDEICIRAMEKSGYSRADAEQYAIIGCVELTAPGKTYAQTEALRVSWAKPMEIYCKNICAGRIPPPEQFEGFLKGYLSALCASLETGIQANDLLNENYAKHWPAPFLSTLTEGCLESGKDAADCGALYSMNTVNATGMANAVDSLLAVKQQVYDRKTMPLKAYLEMVADNFAGQETLRESIWNNCPRFGSDREATALMKTVSDVFLARCHALETPDSKRYQVGYYSVEAHGILGKRTCALPDGRLAGKTLANGFSPVQGTEKRGPTQVLSAVAGAIDHTRVSNGMVLDLKFQPLYFRNPEKRSAIRSLFEGYFELGGMELQCNVVDRETLLKAKANPAAYPNLIVRVSGFSTYFVTLSPEVQDEIIARTEWGSSR